MAIEGQTFEAGEATLSYAEWPGESPPIVLLHALSGSWPYWRPALAIRGERRTLAYDARGHGDSSRVPGGYRFIDYGPECAAFLRGVAGEPAILVGHSLGAMTAIWTAAHHPDLVRAAVLAEPPLYVPERGPGDLLRGAESDVEAAGRPVEELVAGGMIDGRAEQLAKFDGEALAAMLDGSALKGYETDALLVRIRCPVLLMHGEVERGSAILEGELERAASNIAHVEVVAIEGAGHNLHVEQRDAFVEAVRRFLAGLG